MIHDLNWLPIMSCLGRLSRTRMTTNDVGLADGLHSEQGLLHLAVWLLFSHDYTAHDHALITLSGFDEGFRV